MLSPLRMHMITSSARGIVLYTSAYMCVLVYKVWFTVKTSTPLKLQPQSSSLSLHYLLPLSGNLKLFLIMTKLMAGGQQRWACLWFYCSTHKSYSGTLGGWCCFALMLCIRILGKICCKTSAIWHSLMRLR